MKTTITVTLLLSLFFVSCSNNEENKDNMKDTVPNITEEAVTYSIDSSKLTGYVYYDMNKEGKRPGILVVHEWWGLNDYARSRAKQLAELGYVAMAVDMYGNGEMGENPQQAQALATPFYQDPTLTKKLLDPAIEKLKGYAQTDGSKIGAIGYCFGGYVVLNAAKLGADLDAVVSFHGGLSGVPPTEGMKTKMLVLHGEADQFVGQAEVDNFKKQMDSVHADYTFKSYPDATHAFTNPKATENGQKFSIPIAYNAAADSASWNDMKAFFEKVFK